MVFEWLFLLASRMTSPSTNIMEGSILHKLLLIHSTTNIFGVLTMWQDLFRDLLGPVTTSFQHFLNSLLGFVLFPTPLSYVISSPLESLDFCSSSWWCDVPLQLSSHSDFCLSVNSSTAIVCSPRLETSVTFSLLGLYTHFITKSYQFVSYDVSCNCPFLPIPTACSHQDFFSKLLTGFPISDRSLFWLALRIRPD